MKRIESFNSKVFLVNTGWTGGPHGIGSRFDIPTTRRIINAIQNGELNDVETAHIDGLNLEVPVEIDGVDPKVLIPKILGQIKMNMINIYKILSNNLKITLKNSQ